MYNLLSHHQRSDGEGVQGFVGDILEIECCKHGLGFPHTVLPSKTWRIAKHFFKIKDEAVL